VNLIKAWLRNWAAFDLTVVVLAAALIGGYINYKQNYTDDGGPVIKPLVDLWPNVGSEVLGIYFSVRVSDALIQSRERHHAIRRRVVYSFSTLIRSTRDLLPECYEFRLTGLKAEFTGLKALWQKWRKKFSTDEIADVKAAGEACEALLKLASELRAGMHKLDDTLNSIDHAIDTYNEQGQQDKLYRHSLKWLGRLEKESRKLRERGTFDQQVLDDAFVGVKTLAAQADVATAVSDYLNAAKELDATYKAVAKAVGQFEELALKANRNILEESEHA
jgi:hypothetical protein